LEVLPQEVLLLLLHLTLELIQRDLQPPLRLISSSQLRRDLKMSIQRTLILGFSRLPRIRECRDYPTSPLALQVQAVLLLTLQELALLQKILYLT
jgi:hypothetical protein